MDLEFQLAMVVGLVLFFTTKESMQQNNTELLRAATIIFRHGDRNPIKSYPGDPLDNETMYWPEGYGGLTMAGKVRLYNLGRYMRKRYPTFQRKNVVVYSSDQNRTITSAMANLAGFYGQNRSFLKHVDSFNPRGIGVNVVPKNDDDFIMINQPCPKYRQVRDEYLNETRPMAKYKDALKIINEKTGLNFSTYNLDIVLFADTIIIQKSRNLPLPEWIQDLYDDDVFHEIRDEFFIHLMPTLELKRLRTGAMVKRFLDAMDEVVDTTVQLQTKRPEIPSPPMDFPRITIVSGHDSTLADWMIDLEVFEWEGPPYGAAIFMELYQTETTRLNNTTFVIKIFYKNDSENEPVQMSLPRCPNPCYYNNFKKLLEPLVVHNRQQECQVSNHNTDTDSLGSDHTLVTDTNSVLLDVSHSNANACKILSTALFYFPVSLLLMLYI